MCKNWWQQGLHFVQTLIQQESISSLVILMATYYFACAFLSSYIIYGKSSGSIPKTKWWYLKTQVTLFIGGSSAQSLGVYGML